MSLPMSLAEMERENERDILARMLGDTTGKTLKQLREQRDRELELLDITSRVDDYAAQFEASGKAADFQIKFAPMVAKMIRKLKNDESSVF